MRVQIGDIGGSDDDGLGRRLAQAAAGAGSDADAGRAARLERSEAGSDGRLERLRRIVAGDDDDQPLGGDARGAMEVEQLAFLQRQVAFADGAVDQRTQGRGKRGIRLQADDENERVDLEVGKP